MSNVDSDGPKLTTRDVADRMEVTTETVRIWWKTGKLPGVQLGWRTLRFTEADVAEFEQGRASSREVA
jgi:excisionase family DNA binding protein